MYSPQIHICHIQSYSWHGWADCKRLCETAVIYHLLEPTGLSSPFPLYPSVKIHIHSDKGPWVCTYLYSNFMGLCIGQRILVIRMFFFFSVLQADKPSCEPLARCVPAAWFYHRSCQKKKKKQNLLNFSYGFIETRQICRDVYMDRN